MPAQQERAAYYSRILSSDVDIFVGVDVGFGGGDAVVAGDVVVAVALVVVAISVAVVAVDFVVVGVVGVVSVVFVVPLPVAAAHWFTLQVCNYPSLAVNAHSAVCSRGGHSRSKH